MSSLLRHVFVLALGLCCVGFPSAANSQTKTPKKPLAGSVSGRVTLHGKGAAGIVVAARSSDFSQPAAALKGTTDPDGNYRITGIPAGSYQVSTMAAAYVLSDLLLARTRGKTLLLAEGEDVQDVDFSLERGGVIAGRVTDAEGRPVVEERLTLSPADQNIPNQQMYGPVSASGSQTDDRGVYRIYGLVPGRYKIFVGRDDDNYYSSSSIGRVAYKRTFYPDVTDPADAKIIEVTEGSEATNIDITLGQTLPGFVASGRVVDGETGQPVTGLRLGLRRMVNNDYGGINAFVTSNSQGEFRLENVTAGKYSVLILPMPGIETRADAVSFEVVDQDATGLLVKAFKGLSISGIVVVDGKNDSSVLAKLAELRLYAYVRSEGPNTSFGQASPISTDGSFRIGGLSAGTVNFSLGSQEGRPLVNFSILRVERDGVAQPRGFELSAGEPQVAGVKIVLKYGTGSIRGEVKLENGPLPAGGRVMVWLKKAGEAGSTFRPSMLDSRGHFLIEGVSAGDYELHVQANIPGREPPSATQPITVSEGTVSDVAITVDLKPRLGQPPAP